MPPAVALTLPARSAVATTLRQHWPEYCMEAVELGLFMLLACAVVVGLEHPESPVHRALGDPTLRRVLTGLAMGGTAVGISYSPFGKRSGAHFNPAVTLTFLRLGKIAPADAAAYVVSQFAGGIGGVLLATVLLDRMPLAHPAVAFAATVPGPAGPAVAFAAESAISFVLMATVLTLRDSRFARFTACVAGALVALWIAVEAPLSGMSMNPARTFASAVHGGTWTALWVYFLAPPLGMLAAAEAFLRLRGAGAIACAKLHHENPLRCIFRCGYHGSDG